MKMKDNTDIKSISEAYVSMLKERKIRSLYRKDVKYYDSTSPEDVAAEIEAQVEFMGGPDEAPDGKDFMKVVDMMRKGKIRDARRYAQGLDSDPRDFLLDAMRDL
jgi:hypothetical protein